MIDNLNAEQFCSDVYEDLVRACVEVGYPIRGEILCSISCCTHYTVKVCMRTELYHNKCNISTHSMIMHRKSGSCIVLSTKAKQKIPRLCSM